MGLSKAEVVSTGVSHMCNNSTVSVNYITCAHIHGSCKAVTDRHQTTVTLLRMRRGLIIVYFVYSITGLHILKMS